MRSKKGQEKKELVEIVLLVAVILEFVAVFIFGIYPKFKSGSVSEKCRATISIAKDAEEDIPFLKRVRYQCPADYYELEGNKKQIIGQAYGLMEDCWWKTSGEESGLGFRERVIIGEKDVDVAFVCSEFSVEKEVSGNEFTEWLSTTVPGESQDYAYYVEGSISSPNNNHFLLDVYKKDTLDPTGIVDIQTRAFSPLPSLVPGKDYIVVYVYNNLEHGIASGGVSKLILAVISPISAIGTAVADEFLKEYVNPVTYQYATPQNWKYDTKCWKDQECRYMVIIPSDKFHLLKADLPYWESAK
jgi:hypothetical protein